MAYYNRFKVLLADYVDKPTIPTVVALLTCGTCLVPRGMQSAGWIFCGIGYRMLTDIGCHLDVQTVTIDNSNYRSSAIDLELRKRVYWGAYVGDMLQSLFLGRSPTMPEVHGTVSREYLDSYEELEEWKPYLDPAIEPLDIHVSSYQPRPSYALSTFQSLLGLCDIMGRVIRAFYSTTSAETSEETLLEQRDKVREQLLRWKAGLPEWLQFEPGVDVTPPPHQITPQ
ncbi:nitrogen assimilation transcription factor nira [Colletotrichum chrysophilum]|uniref:Nitrogen assimilation transcription factor nira n=1 Tax=Colletotrichum chrysophilum TaxID=1836956 RepID=A0AAD9B1S1_9PEZI|nr:nitrogen assimilation transcription factor nira [Colletotrichum chrysophilum]